MGNTPDYLWHPKFIGENQVHSHLFSTTHNHGTRKKEGGGEGMLLSLFLHQSNKKTFCKNLMTNSLGTMKN